MLEQDKLFKLESIAGRGYNLAKNNLMEISIEVNRDQTLVIRKCFDILELLSDVGGIHSVMWFISVGVLTIFNYANFYTFMASRLFKIRRKNAGKEGDSSIFE